MSEGQGQTAPPADPGTPEGDGTATSDGFLVGVDPKTPPPAGSDWSQPESAVSNSQNPTIVVPNNSNGAGTFTMDDIERARAEEKDKLYGRMSQMDERLKSFEQEREEREAAEKAAAEAAEAERKQAEEEKMEVRDLLAKKESEWNSRFDQVEQERATEKALFEKERRFTELQNYGRDRIAQEQEFIMPELRDLVDGNTEEEIDASIASMKERSAAIMAAAQGQAQVQRQEMRGTAPTAPPVGPLEQEPAYNQMTPQDVEQMDMETYKKHRGSLLQGASAAYNRGGR